MEHTMRQVDSRFRVHKRALIRSVETGVYKLFTCLPDLTVVHFRPVVAGNERSVRASVKCMMDGCRTMVSADSEVCDSCRRKQMQAYEGRPTTLTLYRMVMPIGTPFLKEKINN